MTLRPDEAEVIRSVDDPFLAGESLRSMATWLDTGGIVTVFASRGAPPPCAAC